MMLLGILPVMAAAKARPTATSDLFSRASMQTIDLRGMHVWLGQPVQVTAQLGWKMGWPHYEWEHAFTHLTPTMARFPGGELLATYALDSDAQSNPVFASGYQISKDGGAHWGRRYSMLMQHIPMTFIPKPDDALMALPSELFQQTPGDEHNFVGPYYLFERGGERMVFVPEGVRVVDWPWPVDASPGTQPLDNWHVGLVITGNALQVGDKLLATGYFHKKGESTLCAVILVSRDGGYTWRYLSTVASSDPSLISQRAYEGADEMSMVQLADGDLMAVFRVGSGRKWNLHRAYSHDQGQTWTQPDVLPAWSVYPQLLRTANGTLVLATGRPGIDLWLSTDPRGTNWQSVDIVEHHNRCVTDPSERIGSFEINPNAYLSETTKWQTSSYTGLVEVAPNRLLLLYDRDPERIPLNSDDLSRVFVMPIEIEPK
jgi:hypothetical protein